MKVPVETMWSALFIDIWRPFGMIVSSFHDICCPNPVIVNIVRESCQIAITCNTDDKESNLKISINEKGE